MLRHSLHVKNNYWCVSFYTIDRLGNKKQHQISTHVPGENGSTKNKRKAEDAATLILEKYENPAFAEEGQMLLCDYVKDWVDRQDGRLEPTTLNNYRSILHKHIIPYFKAKKLKLADVKPIDLERYYSTKLSEGVGANTVIKHHAVIRTALQDAYKNDYINCNPADKATKPKRTRPVHDFYTADEMRTLIDFVKGSVMELPVMLAMTFGLRREEVVGLKWSAIDFENKTLTVCNKITQACDKDGKLHLYESSVLKTESSNRTFPLNDLVCEYLRGKREEQLAMYRSTTEYIDYVTVNEAGELIRPECITNKFGKVLEAAGLRKIRYHDLRHSCLSLIANDPNFTMKQVQEYAGHADFLITANTYSHVTDSAKRAEVDMISRYILR